MHCCGQGQLAVVDSRLVVVVRGNPTMLMMPAKVDRVHQTCAKKKDCNPQSNERLNKGSEDTT